METYLHIFGLAYFILGIADHFHGFVNKYFSQKDVSSLKNEDHSKIKKLFFQLVIFYLILFIAGFGVNSYEYY